MRSMAIQFDPETPLHLTIRPSSKFSHSISHLPPVQDLDAFRALAYNDPQLDFAAFPGPLVRVLITYVESAKSAGFVYMLQHSVFDAIYIPMFVEDLEACLADPYAALPQRPPYKAWADSYYNLRDSIEAKRITNWHVKRLKGISQHKDALFPPQRTAEWFKGDAQGWIDLSSGKPGPVHQPLDNLTVEQNGLIGCTKHARIANTSTIRSRHGIEAPQIVKAAIAIVEMRHTSTSVVLFGQYQTARTWPFLANWQARRLLGVVDISGPTLQIILAKIALVPGETVLDFLVRLQGEQAEYNRYQHAPYYRVLEQLNSRDNDDGDVVEEALRRQIFNWLPGGRKSDAKIMEKVQQLSRTDVGILWDCGTAGEEEVRIHASWDDAQLQREEVERLLEEIGDVVDILGREENWGTVEEIR